MERLTWYNGEHWTQVQSTKVGYKDICERLALLENIIFDEAGNQRVSFDRLGELVDAEVGVCSLEEMTYLHETEGLGKCIFQRGLEG